MALATDTTSSTITRLELVESLDSLAGEWNALAGDVPFRSYDWLAAWWRHFGGGTRRLFTVSMRNSEHQLIGIAPWYIERLPGRGRVVRFLGSDAVCSDYMSLLCLEDREREVAGSLAAWLAGPAARDWDLLEFEGVSHDDPAMAALVDGLTADGLATHRQPELQCWRVQLPSDWDSFLAVLSSSRRHRTRTLLRRNIDQGRTILRAVADADDLAHVFPRLVDLHQKRRRSLGQEGCFASQRFTDFHWDVSRAFLNAGRLRMLWLELEGQAIAVQYGFVGGDTVYYYQGGFDPATADESPGWLCLSASLRRAIEEGYRAFDFLRGDEPYKVSWRAEARPLVRLRTVGRRPSAKMRHAAWRTGEAVKDIVRRWKTLPRGSTETKERD